MVYYTCIEHWMLMSFILLFSFNFVRSMLLRQRMGWTFMILVIVLNIYNFCWFCCVRCHMHLELSKAGHYRYARLNLLVMYFVFWCFRLIENSFNSNLFLWKQNIIYNRHQFLFVPTISHPEFNCIHILVCCLLVSHF